MSSPRFGRRPGYGNDVTGREAPQPESTTSAFSTTSYEDTKDATNTSRDVTRDTSYSQHHRDDIVPQSKRGVIEVPRSAETSTDTERHGSYDFQYPAYDEKVEWSCDEAGGWQKLSFLLLVIAFLGHAIAVCTPYWVVGYLGDEMTLYEGVWLSCYREQGFGRWVCSTFDTIRHLFEQPPWYEASQICAVLSVILLLPTLVAATLYSYVVSLSGRSRASWVLIAFLSATILCSFLSFVVFGAGYPSDQDFPPGNTYFHASFGLQIVSFLVCCLCLAAHVKDSYYTLKIWDNNRKGSAGGTVVHSRNMSSARPTSGPRVASSGIEMIKPHQSAASSRGAPKLPSFSLPKFPAALSRFRSRGEKSPSAPPPPFPPPFDSPEHLDRRETSAERIQTFQAPPTTSGAPSQRVGGNTSTYRSYAASSAGGSVGGYDSQV